jgi:hypothetical protein
VRRHDPAEDPRAVAVDARGDGADELAGVVLGDERGLSLGDRDDDLGERERRRRLVVLRLLPETDDALEVGLAEVADAERVAAAAADVGSRSKHHASVSDPKRALQRARR